MLFVRKQFCALIQSWSRRRFCLPRQSTYLVLRPGDLPLWCRDSKLNRTKSRLPSLGYLSGSPWYPWPIHVVTIGHIERLWACHSPHTRIASLQASPLLLRCKKHQFILKPAFLQNWQAAEAAHFQKATLVAPRGLRSDVFGLVPSIQYKAGDLQGNSPPPSPLPSILPPPLGASCSHTEFVAGALSTMLINQQIVKSSPGSVSISAEHDWVRNPLLSPCCTDLCWHQPVLVWCKRVGN